MVGSRSSGRLGAAVLASGGSAIGTGPEAVLVGACFPVGAEMGYGSRGLQVWVWMDLDWGWTMPDEGKVLLL